MVLRDGRIGRCCFVQRTSREMVGLEGVERVVATWLSCYISSVMAGDSLCKYVALDKPVLEKGL